MADPTHGRVLSLPQDGNIDYLVGPNKIDDFERGLEIMQGVFGRRLGLMCEVCMIGMSMGPFEVRLRKKE
jgi:hypothetical protein